MMASPTKPRPDFDPRTFGESQNAGFQARVVADSDGPNQRCHEALWRYGAIGAKGRQPIGFTPISHACSTKANIAQPTMPTTMVMTSPFAVPAG